jgi:hypothetical protein
MGPSDMLLHGAITFFAQTSFPTIGAIIVLQGTNDLIIGIGHGKGAGQGRSRRHDLHESVLLAAFE